MLGLFAVASENSSVHGEFLDAHADGERVEPWLEVHRRHLPDADLTLGLVDTGVLTPTGTGLATGETRTALIDGEILNSEELWRTLAPGPSGRGSDADLVLALSAHSPVRTWIPRCRGAFTILVWDGESRTLTIATDRLALRPHVVAFDGRNLVIGPSLRFALGFPWVSSELDGEALFQIFAFQTPFDDRTLFRDVRALPAGTVLTFRADSRELREDRYWFFDPVETRPGLSFEETVEGAADVFARAVRRRTATPHRYGLTLSGGLDSRLIAAAVSPDPEDLGPVHAFTYGVPDCRDMRLAARVGAMRGLAHHTAPFHSGAWIRDVADRHVRRTEFGQCLLHAHGAHMVDAMRERADVILTGFAGGPLLGGCFLVPPDVTEARDPDSLIEYLWRRDLKTGGRAFPEEIDLRRAFGQAIRPTSASARDALTRACEAFRHVPLTEVSTALCLAHRTRRLLLPALVFARPAVEDRNPYCDEDLHDFLRATPVRHRRGRRLQRAVLDRLAPDLAEVPLTATDRPATRRGGARRRWRMRRRFARSLEFVSGGRLGGPGEKSPTDYGRWVHEDLADWAREILLDERTLDRGVLAPDFVRETFETSGPPTRPWTWRVGLMLSLELALRHLVDDESGPLGS